MTQHLALLFTDVVDSTAINAALGDAAMSKIWDEHDRLTRTLIRECHGQEVGRSDGFLVVFERTADAVAFAAAYHEALRTLDEPLTARVGIHTGEVELRRNRPEDVAAGATAFEIDGVALPVAARVSALARGQQTLLTASACEHMGSSTLKLASHGHWRVKGVPEPIELFEIGDSHASFVPPADNDKAYRVLLDQGIWLPARDIRHSIPAEQDDFVGRQGDLRRLFDVLDAGARLISVVGIGGVGKTRLVTHFAKRWLGEFEGGAWFCDLSEARDADGIWSAVALGLDVSLGRAEPRIQLSDVIAARGRCLVILDNFEQILSLGSEIVSFWLSRAPNARFIVTSRERLGCASEHIVGLDSLERDDAASLFNRRAKASHPNFQPAASDVAAIEKLVELLDGLPLAIELAVGRLGVMSARTMLTRIGERFMFLSSRSKRLRRQSTLRAAFDWSWDLLTLNEQCVLAQASVFAGGFELDAGESVLSLAHAHGQASVLDTLHSLVDKSFIRISSDRFSLLVSVREYAEERLGSLVLQSPELAAAATDVEGRHSRYFADHPTEGGRAAAAELENILAACKRSIAQNDAELAVQTCANAWKVLEARGPYRAGIELVESALAINGLVPGKRSRLAFIHGRCLLVSGDAQRARTQLELAYADAQYAGLELDEVRALASLAELNMMEGKVDHAGQQFEEAVRRSAGLGDVACHCSSLNGWGVYFNRLGQFEAAGEQLQRALEAARKAENRRWEGAALNNLFLVAANLGNRSAARSFCDQAIVVARELGDRVWEGNLLCNLGLFKLEGGELGSAQEDLDRSLVLAREAGLSLLESVVLCNIGLLRESVGDLQGAEESYRGALQVARRRGDRRSEGQFLGYLGLLVARLGDPSAGRGMLVQGIDMLRQVKDKLSLAIALARYARGCLLWNDLDGGTAFLEEASQAAIEMNSAAGSELSLSIASARQATSTKATAG